MSEKMNDDTGQVEVSANSKISNFAQSSESSEEIDDSTVLSDVRQQSSDSDEKIVSDSDAAQETQAGEPPFAQSQDSESDRGGQNPTGSRAEFTTAFDIIDEMQKNLDEAKSVLFSSQYAKVDREKFSEYLDELKKVLPVQLERASALMRESERRLEAAQEQSESVVRAAQANADQIVAKANEQADFLAGHQNVVALAEEKARSIIDTAQGKADKVTQGANEYSATMLANLDTELDKLSRDVKGGISLLRTREQEAASKLHRIDGSEGSSDDGQR